MKNMMRAGLLAGLVLTIAGCGGSDGGGIGGGDPASGCVDQTLVTPGVVDITNTCDDTIIVLVTNGSRFVLEPGAVNRVSDVTNFTNYAACFAPSEPDFKNSFQFECT